MQPRGKYCNSVLTKFAKSMEIREVNRNLRRYLFLAPVYFVLDDHGSRLCQSQVTLRTAKVHSRDE